MWIVLALISVSLIQPMSMANGQIEWIAEHRFAGEALTATHSKAGLDSLNVRFVGSWPFGPSYAVCVDSARNLVFAGSGGGVYVLDVLQVSNPVKVSVIRTRGVVYGLYYDNTTQMLYVADGQRGLEIWSIEEPSAPVWVSYYYTPDYALGVYVSGGYAYVADGDSGLRVIDISDPSNPEEVGYYDTPGCAWGVYISEGYAYVTDHWTGLRIIDVSDPSNPEEVGYYDTCLLYTSPSPRD